MYSDELDYRIFKVLLSDKFLAVDFATSYNFDLFNKDMQLFAKLFLGYTKGFRAPPTRRVLNEWSGEAYSDTINKTWDILESIIYDVKEYPYDLSQFKKRYINESLQEVKGCIEAQNSDSPDKVMKDISIKLQNIKVIQQGKTFIQKTVKDNIDDFEDRYKAKVENPVKESDNVFSGYSGMDFAVGGFKPSDLFIIGGETGAGKSMLLLNAAIQMWMQKNTINTPPSEFTKGFHNIYFSLEMPYEECYTRFLAKVAQVNERSIVDGQYTTDQRNRILKAQKFIKAYPYEFEIVDVPKGVTTEQIELRYNDALLKYKPDICVVDYLNIMSGGGESEQDWLRMGELGGELHEFGRVYNVIMGTAVQLNDIQRGSKTDPKDKSIHQRVGPHRIGRSSQILHHATLGIQIESKPGDNESTFLNYHIIKNRRGPKLMASLNKNFEMCTLSDIEYVPNRQRNNDLDGPKTQPRDESLLPDISKDLQITLSKNKIAEIKKNLNHN